ncbi:MULTISPECIES: hypothetical protein [unclassified Dietzia]|uniref:hypothetical protein n=1 Tax=unclassified Dietzia TaxID=2617939 RepID=UPI000D1FE888|nr:MULTISPECIES: hypothetical protein [unclassified Dietzia]AVZ40287.1 hypothetical protein CT688_13230 [Dietzia sp. JS16-p6b]QGW25763.1 hypothetical protein GJR88_04201 [Dietzia sp. DQ12-45-1b]
MGHEIELVNDGDGVAVIGDRRAVEQFLDMQGIESRELDLRRLGRVLSSAAGVAQAGSEVAENSGRWVKLTEASAAAMKQSKRMKGSEKGVSRAVLTENNGRIKGILEIVDGPGQMLANPAVLAGAAGIMAQLAMQQTMDEITDYLAVIDAKVDDILRSQKDAVLADMIGVELVIEEALVVREHVGRVSEVTWSKVQATAHTVARTQGYALRQLDGIAEKLEKQTRIGDIADTSRTAQRTVQEWLAVLARCFQLQDGLAVLELDRVLDASPEELDRHREAVQVARRNRLELIGRSTEELLARMDAAAGTANAKVLIHPRSAQTVVHARNDVVSTVVGFEELLGFEGEQSAIERRRWLDAAVDARDKVVETGAESIVTAVRAGGEGLNSAKSATGRFASGVAQRLPRRRARDSDDLVLEP